MQKDCRRCIYDLGDVYGRAGCDGADTVHTPVRQIRSIAEETARFSRGWVTIKAGGLRPAGQIVGPKFTVQRELFRSAIDSIFFEQSSDRAERIVVSRTI